MTEAEGFILIVGVLLAVFGLAYGVRKWPHDTTNDEFWP
jgi:hypothetical protein